MSDASTPPSGWWTKMISSGTAATMLSPSPIVPDGAALSPTIPNVAVPASAMSTVPSPNGATGRDRTTGRFTQGNPGGPGNPFALRVAKLRSQMLGAVSEDDMSAIVAAVVAKAKAGDLAAARVVFDYLVGKPQVTVDPDRVDIDGETLAYEKERRARAKYEASLGFRTAV